jgi:hypothetical protein
MTPQPRASFPLPANPSSPHVDAVTVLLPEDGPVLTPGLARALVRLVRNTAERELSTSSLPPAA